MTKVKLTYFDFSGSRGEEVRVALAIAGVDFDDNRISRDTFQTIKPNLPYAALPTLEIEGIGVFGQSNAILRLIGRMHGLHPQEPYEAARHDGLMDAAEDLRHEVLPTMQIKDEDERLAKRRQLAEGYIPHWASCVERQIGRGPFVGGERPHVADIKLYMVHKWISSGNIDGIPAQAIQPFEKLQTLADGITSHPAVVAWYISSN